MTVSGAKDKCSSMKIDGIGISNDILTSRGGLALFVKYLSNIGLLTELENRFGRLRKSAKGVPIIEAQKLFSL